MAFFFAFFQGSLQIGRAGRDQKSGSRFFGWQRLFTDAGRGRTGKCPEGNCEKNAHAEWVEGQKAVGGARERVHIQSFDVAKLRRCGVETSQRRNFATSKPHNVINNSDSGSNSPRSGRFPFAGWGRVRAYRRRSFCQALSSWKRPGRCVRGRTSGVAP